MEYRVENAGPGISVKTFVLFDTETTGLPSPGYNPRITELCFIAVTREELFTKQKTSRVLNKLVICFNPCQKIELLSSQITGLHNDALEDLASFSKQSTLITTFLRNLPQPVCLIAHNGNWFDFPLLVSQLRCGGGEIPEGILCTDSLEALRTFDGLPPVPEFVLQKKKAKNGSAVPVTANTQSVKSVQEISEASGNVLELNRTQSIEGQDKTDNMKSHLSGNDSCDSLKRTAESLEISDVNSKHAKVSSTHEAIWDKVEHTPRTFNSTKLYKPEVVNNSGKDLHKKSNQVKRFLFKDDCGGNIENKSSDLHPALSENMMPTGKEDVNLCQNVFANSVNDKVLFDEGSSTRNKNGTAEIGTSKGINSSSANYNTRSLTESQDNIIIIETKVKSVGEESADSPVITQNCNSLGNNSAAPVTSTGFVNNGVNKCHNIQRAEKLSYSLSNVYARLFGQQPSIQHTAEADCLALLEILRRKIAEFSSWCDSIQKESATLRRCL